MVFHIAACTVVVVHMWHTKHINFMESDLVVYFIACAAAVCICDWLWENPPVTHKDNYLDKRNWIFQSVISPEGLKLQACNLQCSYGYSRSIRLSYLQCTASWISCHFRSFFYQHHKQLYWGGGWRVGGGGEPRSGGLQRSCAFSKVKWSTRRPHCTQTVTKHS